MNPSCVANGDSAERHLRRLDLRGVLPDHLSVANGDSAERHLRHSCPTWHADCTQGS